MSDSLPPLKTKSKHLLKRLFRSGFSRRLLVSLLAFLILVPTILLLLRPNEVSAVWYDDNYSFRQKFTFTHNADLPSPQRISFTLNTQNLVSNGVMQADCDDTRFTDLNGKVLRFKLTGTCNAGSTTYDVVFPTVVNGTNVGYVYYGNPRAVSASQDVSDVGALTPSGGNPSVLTRANEEQAPSPALIFLFDEGYGSTTKDTSQNQNNGAVRGATWKNKELCVSQNCLQFNGVSDSVIATNAAAIDFDTGLATGSAFQAWIRVNSTGENGVGQIFNKGTNTYMRVTNSANGRADLEAKLDLVTTDATVTISQGIELNKWTHVAMTYNHDADDEITVYINGVNKGSSTNGDGAPQTGDTNDLILGGPNQAHFKGFIDEFKIYPYERTNAAINSDVSAVSSIHGKSASIGPDDSFLSDGLVGYWKMDDGVGNPCASGVDKACDSSGNGNTGTWQNGTASTSGKFGFATKYDGSDNDIDAGNATTIQDVRIKTVTAWIKMNSFGGGSLARIVDKRAGGNGWTLYVNNTTATSAIGFHQDFTAAGDWAVDNTLTTGSWYHVAAVFDSNSSANVPTFYVNGVQYAPTTTIQNPSGSYQSDAANNLLIGNRADLTRAFDGQIDDIRIYNRALTSSEISRLYDWAPGPVGYWKLDERTGTQAFDSSGNGNTGTLTNGPEWATGKVGQALEFNGNNQHIEIADADSFSINTTNQLTVSVWAARNRLDVREDPVDKGDAGNKYEWGIIAESDGTYAAYLYNTTSGFYLAANDTTQVKMKEWHHVVMVADFSVPKVDLYVDGVLRATDNSPSGTFTGNNIAQLRIGERDDESEDFDGKVDDVRVYNYALTPKQIVSVMNADHPAVGSPIGSAIAHYKFDEGYGTTANNLGSQGPSLNGTLTNVDSPATYGSGWTDKGKFGKALNFDGVNDYVDMGNPTAAQITSDLTLSSWVYLSSNTANQDIIAKRGLSSQWGYRLWVDSTGTPKIDVSSTSNVLATASASQTLNKNQWYHLLGTYSASQSAITIYVNGVQKGQTISSVPNSLQNSTANLNIGREAGAVTPNYVNGALDEVKIYNYALSPDEVKTDYNQGKSLVLGALSTDPDGITATNSASRAYCVPGDTATCNPPIAHWTFDERTGTTANDITGNANTGTLTNGPTWSTGKVGQALSFDGVDDVVQIGAAASLNLVNDLTISAWVKQNASNVESIIYDHRDDIVTPGAGFNLQMNRGGVCNACVSFAAMGGDRADSNEDVLTKGVWQHLEVVRSGTTVSFYVDGVSAGSGTVSSITTAPNNPSHIGNDYTYSGGESFKGSIDDVRIYNYVRTPALIAWDYNRGGPVGWWKFDDCQTTTAHDASGNSYDQTITPGTATVGTCVTSSSMWGGGAGDGTTNSGRYNYALTLNGSDNYASTPGTIINATSQQTYANASWGGWFNPTTGVASKTLLEKNREFRLTTDASSNPSCSIWTAGNWSTAVVSGTPLNHNSSWQHVLCTYDGTNIKVYLNGSQAGSTSQSALIMSLNYTPLTAGHDFGGAAYYEGRIDDVRVYNYALTAPQIRTLYNENAAVRFGPLTGSP